MQIPADVVPPPVSILPVMYLNYYYHDTLYYSQDLGNSWKGKILPGDYRWGPMDAKGDGKYLALGTYSDNQQSYYSLNAGTTIHADGQVANYGTGAKVSADGNVFAFVNGLSTSGLRVSTNQGASWITRNTQYNTNDVCLSQDGRLMYVSDYVQGLYKSDDYGATLTKILAIASLAAATSADGRCVYSKSHVNKNRIYISADAGAAFSYTALSRNVNSAILCTDTTGRYVLLAGGADVFYSDDFGASFTDIAYRLTAGIKMTVSSNSYISPTGQHIAFASFSPGSYVVYVSTDYGATFSAKPLPLTNGTPAGFAIN